MEKINLSESKDIHVEDLDLADPQVLDSIELNKSDTRRGLFQFLFFTAIAIFVFFVPVNGVIPFGIIYNKLIEVVESLVVINGVEVGALLICTIILVATGILSFVGKFFSKKESKIYKYFEADSIIHPFLYLAGGVFILLYFLNTIGLYVAPDMIVGASTGEMVIPGVVVGVAFIIPVGAFFIPFLTDYGCIDFIGIVLEPLMRPLFKTPGKSAVDAVASFVGSTTMGIIITGRMYKSSAYTEKEASIVATCFSAVSIGYALVVMDKVGVGEHFGVIYFTSFITAFLIAAIVCRIPPLSRKKDIFYNGREQSKEELKKEGKLDISPALFKKGVHRGTVKAHTSGNILIRIKDSIIDAFPVMPKVITLLCSIGILGMIIAAYTPIFDWLGLIFLPLVKLVGVPEARIAAAAIPAGITEMFIPTLILADKMAAGVEISLATKYFVIAVSMVQIIFLAESVVVIMSTGLPVNFKEMMIIFVQRTFIAIPLVAIFMHLFFM